jgi:hypothetical protein
MLCSHERVYVPAVYTKHLEYGVFFMSLQRNYLQTTENCNICINVRRRGMLVNKHTDEMKFWISCRKKNGIWICYGVAHLNGWFISVGEGAAG